MKKRMDRVSRREQIAWEALKLAAEGISAITMDSVAKACGIVPSALYRHYRNKDALLGGVRDLVRDKLQVNARRAVAGGATPLEALKRLALAHADLLCDNPGIPRLLFSEAALERDSLRRKELYAVINEYRAAAAKIAARGQALGEIRDDVTPEDVVFMLLGTVVPPSFLFHVSNRELDPRAQVARNLILFEEAVRAKTGKEDA